MTRRSLVIAMSLLLIGAGCTGSREYVCPDPVGKIIQDDCEVYRTKYEALRVELGANLAGLLNVKASLGQSSLRDPSDLIQVLAHRTHALCKDFNACRVPPFEYRLRREQTDRLFTAIATIQGQLKGPLDAESKVKLVRELVRVLSEDSRATSSGGSSSGGAIGGRSDLPRRARGLGSYHSWVPWYGSKLLPPLPRSKEGFPILAGVRFSLAHVFRQESPYGTIGFRPSATLYLAGRVEADDLVTVEWGGGSSDCPIGRGDENGLARLHCEAPKSLVLTGGHITINATYRRGSDGKSALIGQRTVAVLSRQDEDARKGSLTYGLDFDDQAREGRLVFRPYDAMPPELEQPSLVVTLKVRKHERATARCWVNGQVVTAGLEASRAGGQEGMFQDRPRYRSVRPGVSEAVREPHVFWWRYDFALPFVWQRGSAAVPEKMRAWPIAGRWRCVISVEGEPVRELTFRIGSDGKPAVHPRQQLQPDPGWLVETRLLPNPFEASIR
jgi:hypothetical protein